MSKSSLKRLVAKIDNFSPNVIFDVGANVGQSVSEFRGYFPNSRILAFEPVSSSYQRLIESTSSDSLVECYNLALGSKSESISITSLENSVSNSIAAVQKRPHRPVEQVQCVIGTHLCSELAVTHIDYLKIDTEGHDIEVLVGFAEMLREQRISFVQVEAGFNPENNWHAPFPKVVCLMEAFGYRLFGVFDQTLERKRGPVLRRGNIVFVSRDFQEKSIGAKNEIEARLDSD